MDAARANYIPIPVAGEDRVARTKNGIFVHKVGKVVHLQIAYKDVGGAIYGNATVVATFTNNKVSNGAE